jgi:serine/threonine protein kinase
MADNRLKIDKKLDAGGMAEVFIGRLIGAHDIAKRVAIKRILPHLSQHKKFVTMFLDEAKLAMNLSHANVVQTFEVGESNNTYYIVMEYIEGTSLRNILDTYKERRKSIDLGVAVYMVMEAAKGLHYAHQAKDAQGNPLNLVHRDVSPPNILVSKQGEIKVVDFGLAKAASQLEETEPGVIKGKFSYLAPETVMGLEIDARVDVFALGIILYELLTGRRLFYGADDMETIKLVEKCYIPRISALNPEIPLALENCLIKALARDRNRRYKSADEFLDDLNSVLFTYGLKVSSRDIAKVVNEVLADKVEEEKVESEEFFDLNIDLDGDIETAENTTGTVKTENETEDPRDWLNDMGMDDMFSDLGEGDNPFGEAPPSIPGSSSNDELSDDLIEEVLEIEIEPEIEIEEEISPPPVPPSVQSPPPMPKAEPGKDGEKTKKSWFSNLFRS